MPAAGAIDRQVRFAIEHKRLIEVRYNGRLRLAEPHDYGVQKGTPRLLVYQLSEKGAAQDAKARGWRMLDIGKIGICAVSERTFQGSRADDNSQRHFAWDEIFARVN